MNGKEIIKKNNWIEAVNSLCICNSSVPLEEEDDSWNWLQIEVDR